MWAEPMRVIVGKITHHSPHEWVESCVFPPKQQLNVLAPWVKMFSRLWVGGASILKFNANRRCTLWVWKWLRPSVFSVSVDSFNDELLMSLNTAIQKAMFPMNKSAPPAFLRLSFESKCLCLMLRFTPQSQFHCRLSLLGRRNLNLIPLDQFVEHVYMQNSRALLLRHYTLSRTQPCEQQFILTSVTVRSHGHVYIPNCDFWDNTSML